MVSKNNNSHRGENWPYHEDKNGNMVPCASNPCKLHGGTDIMATSPEEATAKKYENRQTGMTMGSVSKPAGNKHKHGSDSAYAEPDRIITDHDFDGRSMFKDNDALIHAVRNAKHIMVDIDGTFGDFTGAVQNYLKEQKVDLNDVAAEPLDYNYGKSDNGWNTIYDKNQPNHRSFSKDYVSMIAEHDAYIHEPVDRTAVEAINRLIDDGVKVTIVTNRGFKWLKPDEQWKHEKALDDTCTWLSRTGLKDYDLVFSGDKDDVDADVYFEDSPKNIDALHDVNKNVVMIPHLYNRDTDCPVISSWSEITDARFSEKH